MDPELEKYYNNFFDLFQTEGWKQLVEELKNNAMALNTIEGVKDNDELKTRQGQLMLIANILNLPAQIENVYNELIAHPVGEDEPVELDNAANL